MPITDLLERNSKLYGEEIALVEINPEVQETQRVTWKEYELIQPTSTAPYRREITWSVFDEKANRVANLLLGRGLKKGQKVAILLMNCLEWLPIYFGILKAGAVAVPLNFRYTAQEIEELTGIETRICVPGHMQRGGSPSPYDRVLATQFGSYAAKMVADENFGITVAMKNNHVGENKLSDIAGKSRLVPDGHGMLEVARRMGISLG